MNFYSQFNEDQFIFENLINQNPNNDGTFLEAGATDGVRFSNTKFFEDYLGFSGVLIEPQPDSFRQLKRNRLKCQCFNYALSAQDVVDMYKTRGRGGPLVTSVVHNTKDEFKEHWHQNSDIIQVPGKRLSTILHEANITYIDFWSLDVEGSEAEVLNTMDWSIPVYALLIEKNATDYEQCITILTTQGFQLHTRGTKETIKNNDIWINPQYHRKNLLYK